MKKNFFKFNKAKNKALNRYFSEELSQKKQNIWRNNQKVIEMVSGIATGAEDSSVNYKEYFYQGMKEKYDIDV